MQGPPETNVQKALCPLLGPLNRCGKRGPVPSCGLGSRCPQEACMGRGTPLSNGVRPGCRHGVSLSRVLLIHLKLPVGRQSREATVLWGGGGGSRGACDILPSDDSASEEAGAEPEGSAAGTPRGCSLSSKRPSLHGTGERHGLGGKNPPLSREAPLLPWGPQCPFRGPRAELVLPWSSSVLGSGFSQASRWATSGRPVDWGLGGHFSRNHWPTAIGKAPHLSSEHGPLEDPQVYFLEC